MLHVKCIYFNASLSSYLITDDEKIYLIPSFPIKYTFDLCIRPQAVSISG